MVTFNNNNNNNLITILLVMNEQKFFKGQLLLLLMFSFTFSTLTAQSVKKYYWQSTVSPGAIPRAGDGSTYIKVYRSENNKPYKILNGNRIDLITYKFKTDDYKIYTVEGRPNLRYWIRPEQVMESYLMNPYNEDAIGVVTVWSEIKGAVYGMEGDF